MSDHYVCLATIADINLANVAAARLHSEGINSRLHGESLGPFPMTIGRLAETQLWVLTDQRESASLVLADLGIACLPPAN